MKNLNIKSLFIGAFIGVLLTVIFFLVIGGRYQIVAVTSSGSEHSPTRTLVYRIDNLTGEVWYSRFMVRENKSWKVIPEP